MLLTLSVEKYTDGTSIDKLLYDWFNFQHELYLYSTEL